MNLSATNDNVPVVTLTTSQAELNETGPPVLVFPDLGLSDSDQSPCNQQLLVAAQVTVETIAADSSEDILMVRALDCCLFVLHLDTLQVTDSEVQIAPGQSQENCSFLLRSSIPIPASSLMWYTCRDEQDRLILTIEGHASIEDYQQLLQSVTYFASAQEPDRYSLNRAISVCQHQHSII